MPTYLDTQCKNLLPEELYISMVMNGAGDVERTAALLAWEAGFDFKSFEWNAGGEDRDKAISSLTDMLQKNGRSHDPDNDAKMVVTMCDLAAFGVFVIALM